MKHAEIIAKLGGVTALSRLLGHKNRTVVQYWGITEKIPRWRWPEVLQAARSKRLGITEADFEKGCQK
jgi:hypothetical protein